jgi:quercetin dioxygenase-like cupin family protein
LAFLQNLMAERVLHNPKTGETIKFLTTSQETNGELFRMGYTMAPHAAIADEHSHPYQEMIIRVQSGTLTCIVGGAALKIAAGETATIPPGVAHFQRNDTEAGVEAIEEYRPAKQMQGFFEVLIGWANDGKTNDAGMPTMLRASVMHRYFKDSIRSSSPMRNLQSLFLAPIGSIVGYRKEIMGYINSGKSTKEQGP